MQPGITTAWCDLHLHTHYSDGLDAPAAVVERALKKGAAAIAITDHDTLAGVAEAMTAAHAAGIECLSGVEISASYGGREVHVLGLGVQVCNSSLQERLQWLRDARAQRASQVLERLAALGMTIGLDPASAENIGRLHIARALQQAGVTRTAQEAFDRFLNPGLPAYVPKQTLPVEEALSLIHDAGGLSFVAHPGLTQFSRSILPELLRLPFDGIEAWHVSHNAQSTSRFLKLARERNLLISGGSDCHGGAKGQIEMGRVRVPITVYEQLAQR